MNVKEPNHAKVLARFFRCVSFSHSKLLKLISRLTHLDVEMQQKRAVGCEPVWNHDAYISSWLVFLETVLG